MDSRHAPVYYGTYLQLDRLLDCQIPLSGVHDETLFIIVHQAFELWFKLILHDLDSVLDMFGQDYVDESSVGTAVARLQRIVEIQRVIIEHFTVLETMTPLDFLEFRDYLVPASGSQSVQFWRSYRDAVDEMLANDRRIILSSPALDESGRERQLAGLERTRESFALVFDPEAHARFVEAGQWRFSFDATLAALLILLYRDRPILQQPFRLLTTLIQIDELFTAWRHRHALMVQRMIGAKIGTGGSSGHDYLAQTARAHTVFTDLFNMSTYLIPRSLLPSLPAEVERALRFVHETPEG